MYLRLEVKKNILTVIIEIHECDFVGGYFMNQWEIYNKAGFVLGGWLLGSLGLHYSNFHLAVSLLCLFKIDIHDFTFSKKVFFCARGGFFSKICH